MAKLAAPFGDVPCPICGSRISCSVDIFVLVRHIGDKHQTTSIRHLIQELLMELKLSTPENIDDVSGQELNELLANLCLYKSTKLGLEELSHKIRGK